jgi:hypothetical protein
MPSKTDRSILFDLPNVMGYLNRINAEPRGMRTAIVREEAGHGYWHDKATIRIDKDGQVYAPEMYMPEDSEVPGIIADCRNYTWPEAQSTALQFRPPNYHKGTWFEFRNIKGDEVVMYQQRLEDRDGGRHYVPWTFWSDNKWRMAEPDGPLPLFGLEQLSEYSTVFIHEGAKAAEAMQHVGPDHPWYDELAGAAHVGWIGGAVNVHRTDWGPLQGARNVYIVADNDDPGWNAVPKISKRLHEEARVIAVEFGYAFPGGFDLADEFPESLYTKTSDGRSIYAGPQFSACCYPACWATKKVPNPVNPNRTLYDIRPGFMQQYQYCYEAGVFISPDAPQHLISTQDFDRWVGGYSDVLTTGNLMKKKHEKLIVKLAYEPGKPPFEKDRDGNRFVNRWRPPSVKPVDGDPTPFLDFVEYLFPDETEEMLRWIATLIGKPERRMSYGVLAVSQMQGVGKTLLGEAILKPLVGESNTSTPGESSLNGSFNGWCAGKSLTLISEIYAGQSWKVYNKLKALITDTHIEVNEKYIKPYTIHNHVHVYATSNSKRALKIEDTDRRWLIPRVAEIKKEQVYYANLLKWLQNGGLGMVLKWCRNRPDEFYVVPGVAAPRTKSKDEMIAESRDEWLQHLHDLASGIVEDKIPVVVSSLNIMDWLKEKGKVYDSIHTIRRVLEAHGFVTYKTRLRVGPTIQTFLISPAMVDVEPDLFDTACEELPKDARMEMNKVLRTYIKSPYQIGHDEEAELTSNLRVIK